jgi:hypothetical protein
VFERAVRRLKERALQQRSSGTRPDATLIRKRREIFENFVDIYCAVHYIKIVEGSWLKSSIERFLKESFAYAAIRIRGAGSPAYVELRQSCLIPDRVRFRLRRNVLGHSFKRFRESCRRG